MSYLWVCLKIGYSSCICMVSPISKPKYHQFLSRFIPLNPKNHPSQTPFKALFLMVQSRSRLRASMCFIAPQLGKNLSSRHLGITRCISIVYIMGINRCTYIWQCTYITVYIHYIHTYIYIYAVCMNSINTKHVHLSCFSLGISMGFFSGFIWGKIKRTPMKTKDLEHNGTEHDKKISNKGNKTAEVVVEIAAIVGSWSTITRNNHPKQFLHMSCGHGTPLNPLPRIMTINHHWDLISP